jgi:hypothetical protein
MSTAPPAKNEDVEKEEEDTWIPPVCRHWRRSGVCLYEAKCKFRHPEEERGEVAAAAAGAGAGAAKGTTGGGGGRKRVKKRGKCGFLRRFLLDTFGVEALSRGPILDVGGRGLQSSTFIKPNCFISLSCFISCCLKQPR